MIFNTKATQTNDSQKLADISLAKGKPNALWHELNETSQAAVSGGWKGSLGNTGFTLKKTVVPGDINPIEEIGIVG